MNIFERASRAKTRFETNRGLLSTEDLWELKLTDLDALAKGVNRALKNEQEESFIATKSTINTELELKLEILKHIIAVKIVAKEAATKAAETKARIARIEEILMTKKDQALLGKSEEELVAELESLKA